MDQNEIQKKEEALRKASLLQQLQEEQIQALSLWLNNGAMTTIAEFQRLSDSQRTAVLNYMMDLIPYAIVLVDDRRYLLVHAGLGGFEPEKALTDTDLALAKAIDAQDIQDLTRRRTRLAARIRRKDGK